MKVVNDEEPLQGALSSKMRGLVPPQKFFQVKTYSDNSIVKCDSNLRVLCQDVLAVFSSGDLGFYALSAKDYVDDYLGSTITLVSGSSVSEAFSHSQGGELARSSSSAGEEVSRARADLFMPAIPVSLSSVIFSSIRAMWGCASAKHIQLLEKHGLTSPSLTIDSESPVKPSIEQLVQHNDILKGLGTLVDSANLLLNCDDQSGRANPTKASLNIPDSSVSCCGVESHLQGTDPSFKMKGEKDSSLHTSATCNQYASFPTSKNQAAGKPGRFGFISFPKTVKLNRWGIPIGLGLYGGGESAANGWGGGATSTPSSWTNTQSAPQGHWGGGPNRPSRLQSNNSPQSVNLKPNQQTTNTQQQSSNSSASQQPNNPANQQTPSSGQQSSQPGQSNSRTNSWAQAAGKGLTSGNGSSDAQKLQNIKEALLSSEGWGGENVNQETTWDLPTSPEPGKDGTTPHWKVTVNNGCDLWENNLRNGGVAPVKPQQAPWGSNPINNYGGTWGEDEEPSENSNVWTAGSGPSSTSNPPHYAANNQPNLPNMWGGSGPGPVPGPPKKNQEWGPNASWNEHGQQRPGVEGGPEWGPHKTGGPGVGPHAGLHPGPPQPGPPHPGGPHSIPHPGTHPTVPHPGPHQGPLPVPHQGPLIPPSHNQAPHGPAPHGPTPHGPVPHIPGPVPHGPPTHNAPGAPPGQWNNSGKDMKPSGWEEPSPPSQRRDDGTAVWGNPSQQPGVSRWKERDMPNPNMMNRPGMSGSQQQCRMPGQPMPGGGGPMKNDQRMWGQPGRNGSWGEAHDGGNAVWSEDSKQGWNEPPINSPSWNNKPKTPTGGPGAWPEQDNMDLPGWNSQNKKEDIEAAFRPNNLGLEEPMMDLGPRGASGGGGGEPWRNAPALDDHSSNPFPDSGGNPNFQQRFQPHQQQQLSTNSQQLVSGSGGNYRDHQVKALMHHIRMAVQAGHLNPQILNQQLAPNTLILLNNMLNQTSLLNKFIQQHSLVSAQSHLKQGGSSSHTLLSLSVHITKTKQQITNLQNQISAQQAMHMKQLQHHQSPQQPPPNLITHMAGGSGGGGGQGQGGGGQGGGPPNAQNEFFKMSLPDQLFNNFNQMAVNENTPMNAGPNQQQLQQIQQQQQSSRLNQWKMNLPNMDNEDSMNIINNDFVRAPGKPSLPPSQSSPNLNPLLPDVTSAWSQNNRPSESGWPDSSPGNRGDGSSPPSGEKSSLVNLESPWAAPSQQAVSSSSSSYGLDIKPFEPGKQWMVKNIEDDPNLTPGSVTRSPLSLGIKDSDLLASITKTTTASTMSDIAAGGPSLLLSSSNNTWSFNPSAGQPTSISSDNKISASNKTSTWSEGTQSTTALTSELWGATGNSSKTRGPPPGMSANNNKSLGANGGSWSSTLGRSTSWSGEQQRNSSNSALHSAAAATAAANPWPNSQMPSTWLLLKNLTTQIDGSTLKTLCMQHGPLINFHLSLNHGFAVVNYSSREEAFKAQENLNNCLLSNTTILAEFASDSEVKQFLGLVAPPTSSSAGKDSWGRDGGGGGGGLWGNGPTSSTTSLWGGGEDRATPLKSYLPDGLLTSESM